MGPKKGRMNVRKIAVSTDTPTKFELGDTAADIQRSREEREQREKGDRQRNNRVRRGRVRRAETLQLHTEEGVAERRPRTERTDSEMDTESGGEASTSQL